MAMHNDMLIEINRFLARTGMAPTRLGRLALGDPGFVAGVRAGRKVYGETAAKVRVFMAGYEART